MEKSKSELLLENILLKIKLIDRHHINLFTKTADGVDPKLIQKEIEQLIMQLYDASIIDNFYYLDCPIEVYKNTYDQRFEEVKESISGLSEVFFLKSELEDLLMPEYKFSKTNLSEFRNYCQNTFYNSSFAAKIEFIRNKLLSIGHVVNISPEIYLIPQYSNFFNHMNISLKYTYDPSVIKIAKKTIEVKDSKGNSDSKQLTLNEIVLLLDKLKVFTNSNFKDYPNTSKAKLLTYITGLNGQNLRSSIGSLAKRASSNSKKFRENSEKVEDILNNMKKL